MIWWRVSLSLTLTLSLFTGCSSGTQKVAKDEMSKYSMESAREGNVRQLNSGTTLNGALLNLLQAECAKRKIRLTHETYAEGLDGSISYSYFINGDARHFLIVHVFPSEGDRMKRITEIYGTNHDKPASVNGASVIAARYNTALVYASSGNKDGQYRDQMKTVFDHVLDRIRTKND